MGLRADVKKIKNDIDFIKSELSPEIVKKAEKYDQLKELLEEIYFDIELEESLDYNGETQYKIIYKNPEIILNFDEYGDPIKNDFFYSMNMLNLLTMDATNKLMNIIVKEKNKKSI